LPEKGFDEFIGTAIDYAKPRGNTFEGYKE
jgi:hypothetical protein